MLITNNSALTQVKSIPFDDQHIVDHRQPAVALDQRHRRLGDARLQIDAAHVHLHQDLAQCTAIAQQHCHVLAHVVGENAAKHVDGRQPVVGQTLHAQRGVVVDGGMTMDGCTAIGRLWFCVKAIKTFQ